MTHDGLVEDMGPEALHRRFLEWRDEAHFLLIALGHLGEALDAAEIRDLGLHLDWQYIRHLRNAWEHDDDRGLYESDYGARHGRARWRERGVDRLDFDAIAADLQLLSAHCSVASEACGGAVRGEVKVPSDLTDAARGTDRLPPERSCVLELSLEGSRAWLRRCALCGFEGRDRFVDGAGRSRSRARWPLEDSPGGGGDIDHRGRQVWATTSYTSIETISTRPSAGILARAFLRSGLGLLFGVEDDHAPAMVAIGRAGEGAGHEARCAAEVGQDGVGHRGSVVRVLEIELARADHRVHERLPSRRE